MTEGPKRTALINVGLLETRLAIVSDGILEDLLIEDTAPSADQYPVGAVYLGRASHIAPAMQAAFVKIGKETSGFLSAGDAELRSTRATHDRHQARPINQAVREGETVLVQVTKEASDKKGPRLSKDVTLPGRFLVLAPFQTTTSVSRRIGEEALREQKLAECEALRIQLEQDFEFECGLILRTAGAQASDSELKEDATRLAEEWEAIQDRLPNTKPPARLDTPVEFVQRALRDLASGDIEEIIIDEAASFQKAMTYTESWAPDLTGRILHHTARALLFDEWNVESQINDLLSSRVDLPSGGWIKVEPTEAMTVVDVNSGTLDHGGGQAQTALQTNLEAAKELARQMRLRAIGGLAIVDFIHMDSSDHRRQVSDFLAACFADDKVATQLGEISEFGTLEFTRKRERRSLFEQMTGAIQAFRVELTCRAAVAHVLRDVERAANRMPGREVHVSLASDLADWLDGEGAAHLTQLKDRLGIQLSIEGIEGWPRERCEVSVKP